MKKVISCEVRKSTKGDTVVFVEKIVNNGSKIEVQTEEIPYDLRTIRKEKKIRESIQKGLFDLSLDLNPLFADEEKESREVIQQAHLQAQESDYSDRFDGVYDSFRILRPPADPKVLVHLTQSHCIFQPIIDSMKANIEGFGQIFVSILDFDKPEVQEKIKKHFKGKLLQELETEGVKRLSKVHKTSRKLDEISSENEELQLVDSCLRESLPTLKFETIESEEQLKTNISIWKSEARDLLSDHEEKIQKIRQRTFDKKLKKLKEEKEDELDYLINFFENCHPKETWIQIKKKLRDDFERIGYSAIEIVRNRSTQRPIEMGHIPAVDLRMTSLENPIEGAVLKRINQIEIVEERRPVRYRKYVQSLGQTGRFIWFKDFGDQRIMDRNNGKYVGEYIYNPTSKSYDRIFWNNPIHKNPIPEAQFKKQNPRFVEANEVIYRTLYNAIGTPYGVPRWFGSLTLVQGLISMEEHNALFFDNNTIPRLLLMVSDGSFKKNSIRSIRNSFDKTKGRGNKDSVIFLEAESQNRSRNFANTGKPVITIEKLNEAIPNDASHSKYSSQGIIKVLGQWRLPPGLIGQETQPTKQSMTSNKVMAEEQIFQPERADQDDVYNKTLMMALRINHWYYQSNNPPIADNLEMAQVLSILGKAGFISVGEARHEVSMILNRPVEDFSDSKLTESPFPLILIETKAKTFENKGPQDDAPENPQNKMGARPDKDGFTTDSEVVKSNLFKKMDMGFTDIRKSSLEKADGLMLDLLNEKNGVFIDDPNGELVFLMKDAFGRVHKFINQDFVSNER